MKTECNHQDFNNEWVGTEEYDYKFFKQFKCSGCNKIWTNNEEIR